LYVKVRGNPVEGTRAEMVLAKISRLRYIASTFFIRYVGVPDRLNHVMKTARKFCFLLSLAGIASALAGPATLEPQSSATTADENSHDLFYYETTYTFPSDFSESKLGHGDSLYDDFSYDHRFLITGKWYLRLGVEYERYDFSGTDNGLPDHLQAASGHVAVEYVVKDHAGASIELDPGEYFQDNATWDAFDIPGKAFVTFPLRKDKIFAVVGIGWGIFQDPPVAPGGGITWLISDKLRVQAVFPKPALVYQPNDDWEFRLLGELNFTGFRTDNIVSNTEHKLNLHDAVLQYSEDRVGAQVAYLGFKPFKISAGAGVTTDRHFNFFRANQEKHTDPAPYLRIAAEAKF
jgi:hypothetical protein